MDQMLQSEDTERVNELKQKNTHTYAAYKKLTLSIKSRDYLSWSSCQKEFCSEIYFPYLFQFYNWSHPWVKAWDRKEEAKPGIQSRIDFSSRADFLPQFEYYFLKIFPRIKVVSKKFLF